MSKLCTAILIALLLAMTCGAAPAQAANVCGPTYSVNPGDTLYSIAQKCQVSYVMLMNINYELSDPGKIYPGQVIRMTAEEPLPFYTQPVSGPAQPDGLQPGGTYIVRKGDSLARIAYLYSTTLTDLYRVNPQLEGKPRVYAGQVINLPNDARQKKGWVGVSSLKPAAYSSIIVRVVDFTPYADITYRVHQVTVDKYYHNTVNAGPGDIERTDYYSLYVDGKTDARGSTRVTIKLPYGATRTETWVVDVFMNDGSVLARSPVMTIQ